MRPRRLSRWESDDDEEDVASVLDEDACDEGLGVDEVGAEKENGLLDVGVGLADDFAEESPFVLDGANPVNEPNG